MHILPYVGGICVLAEGRHNVVLSAGAREAVPERRVARKAIIAFEAKDSLAMRIAGMAGFTSDFELEAVGNEGYESGGVANVLSRITSTAGPSGKSQKPFGVSIPLTSRG